MSYFEKRWFIEEENPVIITYFCGNTGVSAVSMLVNHDFAKRCIRFSVIDTVNKTNTSIISKISTHSIYGFTHYEGMDIANNIHCKHYYKC